MLPLAHPSAPPCQLTWVCWLAGALGLVGAQAQQPPWPVLPLKQPSEVRALAIEQAQEQLPVHLTARVGFIAAPGTVFIQDAVAGTFFRTRESIGHLAIGDLVELHGVTFPGLYLTGIDASSFKVLEHGAPPAATPATFDDLTSGRYHYQRVSLQGIVRRLETPEENRTVLILALGPQLLEVRIDSAASDATAWVDALVEVQGLAAGGINDRRQLVQPYLRVASWEHVRVLTSPAPADAIPTVSATRLLRFPTSSGAAHHQHRVKVRGQVLASFPDGRIYLRESEIEPPTALAARLTTPDPSLTIGQTVSLIGFPHMGGFSARLDDAATLTVEEGTPASPIATTLKALASADLDADLVQFQATLIEHSRTDQGIELRLQDGSATLTALLPSIPEDFPATGSVLSVTGICQVEAAEESGFRARPTIVRLLLRSDVDLLVLQAPAWWTPRRLITLVGVLLGVLVAGLVWISLLHRQVIRQANTLRTQIAKKAVLEERQRIAREFHDTLEQELAGLSIRLGALGSRSLDDKATRLLQTSLQLVSRIQIEARNLVADLRSDDLHASDLRLALEELVSRQAAQAPAIHFALASPLPPLPARIVHHLRMIAQEALTNILKHAAAQHLTLTVQPIVGGLEMQISDDGKGFLPDHPPVGHGHFGCIGIRERCRKMGATVTWQSAPNQGTTVTVQVPLPS
jgi:signal transduction histidine kinase